MIDKEIDILIVGGGLTGAALMLALQELSLKVMLVDAHPLEHKMNADFDARSLALSPASKRILTMLGVWELLENQATAIDLIHVSDQHHFGTTRLQADLNAPLGYVVEMQHINNALHQLLDKQHILAPATVEVLDLERQIATVRTETGAINVSARLIVAADGTHSALRRLCALPAQTKLYIQQAIVANIGLLNPHQNRAYERFTAQGPLALLPMQEQRMSLVWAMPPADATRLLTLPESQFLAELQQNFGYRLGRFTKVGKRFAYPLQQVLMTQQAKGLVVFVGNAAHTLHPVAGQGFNLGLRDVATLAQCIAKEGLTSQMLQHYLQLRASDQKIITHFTDGLISLFTSRLPGLGIARGLGLVALDNIPALKNLLARYARGFGGVVPDLVCEIALGRGHESTI